MTQPKPAAGWFLDPAREQEVREWAARLGASTDTETVGPYSALCDALAEIDRLRIELDGRRDQVLAEAAAKLRDMAQTAPRSRRAGCLSFASGVLDGMADAARPVRPAIDRALERDHSLCGVEPCSDCR